MPPTLRTMNWLLPSLAALALGVAGCSTTAPSKTRIPAGDASPAAPLSVAASSAPTPAPAAIPPTLPDAAATPTPTAAPPMLTGGPPAAATAGTAAPRVLDKLFPQPPALDRDVNFWIRVYTEIGTNAGFLHDQYNLGVVYETLQFGPDTSARQREHIVAAARERIIAALKRIANATGPL